MNKSRYYNNKILIIVYRAVAIILGTYGVLEILGVFSRNIKLVSLMTFTVQSNILVIVLFVILLIKTILYKDGDSKSEKPFGFFPRASAFIAFAISVTMMVYWAILLPSNFDSIGLAGMFEFNNLTMHLLVPLFMIVDYILFNERGQLKKYDPFLCIIIPYIYMVEVLPLGAMRLISFDSIGIHSHYPYIFLDIDKFGAGVILMVVGITLFFIIAMTIWQRIDNKLAKKANR